MIVGIDPGAKGGVAFATRVSVISTYIMPSDVTELQALLAEEDVKMIFIEKAQTFGRGTKGRDKGDGIVGNWTYAKHYGEMLGMFKALRYPFREVPPREWQSLMHKGASSKAQPKDRTFEVCYKLFPHLDFRVPNEKTGALSKKPHDGIADAALICEYGRLNYYEWKTTNNLGA